MLFSRPPLVVGPGARAAGEARRWATSCLHEIDRDDLLDTAELAISEVVANAFLHGTAPISLCLRGTVDRPRIEVHDTSPRPPRIPASETVDVWSTDGRGLSIVARAADAWGVTLDDDGKTVWFEPSVDLGTEATSAIVLDLRTSTR